MALADTNRFLTLADVPGFTSDDVWMLEDVLAEAYSAAPCLPTAELTEVQIARVRGILRGALVGWKQSGAGALSQETFGSGPFSHSVVVDTRVRGTKTVLSDAALNELRAFCATGSTTTTRRARMGWLG